VRRAGVGLRYLRHYDLPQIGFEGQEKISAGSILVVGAGGLGAPVLAYLTAAGVGKIGIVDPDKVDVSNLQRQVIYTEDDIGKYKAHCAKKRLERLNSDVSIAAFVKYIDLENIMELANSYDMILDCCDNFETRFILNKYCYDHRKVFVSASVHHFEGQVFCFAPFSSMANPCYACLFKDAPPDGTIPKCSEAGVFGPLVGVIGCLQASEALKILYDRKPIESKAQKMILFSSLLNKMETFEISARLDCDVCGAKHLSNTKAL
jgi:adenylyltransferase/sulfurtransferase